MTTTVGLALAALVAGCGGGGGGHATSTRSAAPALPAPKLGATSRLRAQAFSAIVPDRWHRQANQVQANQGFFLASAGRADAYGIPPRGQVALTVSSDRAGADVAGLRTPAALVAKIVGRPPGATHVRTTLRARAMHVGPTPGALATFTYTYRGRTIVQQDAVAVRRGRVAFIEADAEPGRAALATQALKTAARSWRWDGSGAAPGHGPSSATPS